MSYFEFQNIKGNKKPNGNVITKKTSTKISDFSLSSIILLFIEIYLKMIKTVMVSCF